MEYPRPQLKRNSFFSLNGVWQLNDLSINIKICIPSGVMILTTVSFAESLPVRSRLKEFMKMTK